MQTFPYRMQQSRNPPDGTLRPPWSSRRTLTVAQLRNQVDSGRTRDKVAAEDPAAAPLGTDDEAAGTAPSGGAVPDTQGREAASRTAPPDGESRSPFRFVMRLLGVAVVLGAALFAIFSVPW